MLIELLLLTSAVTASQVPWPSPAVSWWYVPDSNWPMLVEEVTPHLESVTSIFLYCGAQVTNAGEITDLVIDECITANGTSGLMPSLWNLGVRTELTLGSGNCSIESFRKLWADTTDSIDILVKMAVSTNSSGWNIDLEPQSENCAGTGTGTKQDATLCASWLAVLRQRLNAVGKRLTIDVASWSPVLSQFSVLTAVVDRAMTMDTYNAESMKKWMTYYDLMVNNDIPRDVVSIGLGCWTDLEINSTWARQPESASERITQLNSDHVEEISFWVLQPVTPYHYPSQFPASFWWSALLNYTSLP